MLKVNKQKFTSIWQHKQTILVIVAALLLTLALIAVRAGQPLASFEAEGSILSGNALIKSDTAASGGKFVEFTAGSTPPPPGTILNALDNPSAFGYPDETNTGVNGIGNPTLTNVTGKIEVLDGGIRQNGVTVVTRPSSGSNRWGPITVYPDRTEIDLMDLNTGRIQKKDKYDLIINRSRIIGHDSMTTSRLVEHHQSTGGELRLTDCTLDGKKFGSVIYGWGSSLTVLRCDIQGAEDGVWLQGAGPTRIIDSYIHDLVRPDSEAHADIFQTGGVMGALVSHSTLLSAKKLADDGSEGGLEFDDGWYDPMNAVLMAGNFGSKVGTPELDGIIFEDSLVDGGNYMFNDNWNHATNEVHGITVRNNRFGRHFRFGPKSLHNASTDPSPPTWTWENNVWDDSGEPLN